MKRFLLIVLCGLAWIYASAQETSSNEVSQPHYVYTWQYGQMDTHLTFTTPAPTFQFQSRKLDRGLFGGQAGTARIYCDLTLPTITSSCLVDVGAAMSRMGGLIGSCTRWFTMFDPGACPTDELFGSAKANSAIMVTMRTYF